MLCQVFLWISHKKLHIVTRCGAQVCTMEFCSFKILKWKIHDITNFNQCHSTPKMNKSTVKDGKQLRLLSFTHAVNISHFMHALQNLLLRVYSCWIAKLTFISISSQKEFVPSVSVDLLTGSLTFRSSKQKFKAISLNIVRFWAWYQELFNLCKKRGFYLYDSIGQLLVACNWRSLQMGQKLLQMHEKT